MRNRITHFSPQKSAFRLWILVITLPIFFFGDRAAVNQKASTDQKPNIRSIFEKWQLNESHMYKCDMEWWDNFFGSVTDNPNSLPEMKTFKLPWI